jgi:glycosyltransferase involved in cell wall biosynthesis
LKIILSEKFTEPSKLKVLGNGSSNGIDLDYYTKNQFSEKDIVSKRTDLNIPLKDFVFVFVGRIVTDKGINELVAAFEQIQRIYSNTSLLLVGPFEDDLDPVSEKTSKQITTNPKIITTGYQDDVREFYALSDALVFPSYREGFPNVVLQAGAMELPAIVSDINGCNEIIFDSENGIIIPVKDENKLFGAMEKIMTNKKLYEKIKSNTRSMIASRYDQNEMWQELLNEYKMLQKNI